MLLMLSATHQQFQLCNKQWVFFFLTWYISWLSFQIGVLFCWKSNTFFSYSLKHGHNHSVLKLWLLWTSFIVSSFFISRALLTTSPCHRFLACLCILLVEPLSALSRYHRTTWGLVPFPLQCGAAHLNSWQQCPSTYLIAGHALKNP